MAALLAAAVASSCGGTSGGNGTTSTSRAVATSRPGKIYRQQIMSPIGDSVVFQVFEPNELVAGQTYPLVLHSHGYGGSRETEKRGSIGRLVDAGYYVISIDERGFGESGGTVRVMDPDFEGQDLVAILDWAEGLEGLRRNADGSMVVGSFGGSYGGMFQFLLMGADPAHRLHVLAPDITPHDLVYSLNPGNVIKSGFALALVFGAEGGGPLLGLLSGNVAAPTVHPGLRQDPVIYETLVNGALTNVFPESGRRFFRYHSVKYFCDGEPAAPQHFAIGKPDPLGVPPTPFPKADVLLTQGFRDALFNFNEALDNYDCARALGGDVRLLTHQSGHILPLSLATVPLPPGSNLETALDPFYAALNPPSFQDPGGKRKCGSIDLDAVQFAWFEEKLQGKTGAVDEVLATGDDVCLSLGADDAIAVHEVKVGGEKFAIDASTPQFNAALGVLGAALGNGAREALLATQPLFTVPAGGAILAGVPTMSIEIAGLSGLEQATCPTPIAIGGCDPILFLGIGRRTKGAERWDLVDDQLTPVRGFGAHEGRMTGIAERLAEGDELALLVYGFHAQYPLTGSHDVLVPAVKLSGDVSLPLLSPSEIAESGV